MMEEGPRSHENMNSSVDSDDDLYGSCSPKTSLHGQCCMRYLSELAGSTPRHAQSIPRRRDVARPWKANETSCDAADDC